MSAEYTQADLKQARELAPDASTKQQERIALALAQRERDAVARAATQEQERDKDFWGRVAKLTDAAPTKEPTDASE